MNANELANQLDDAITEPWKAAEWLRIKIQAAATMLRQQQKDYDELKNLCQEMSLMLERFDESSTISEDLIKHLHLENKALRQENEQLQIELNLLQQKEA